MPIVGQVELAFSGEVWEWRGPAPYHFVWVPDEVAAALDDVAPMVSYGWGMIPADVTIGDTEWYTALWPKDGRYVVPLKDRIRKAEGIELGMVVDIALSIKV
jgi:hypothetical protein